MSIKKISTNTVYSVEMTQTQLDKIYGILAAVEDADTDKVFSEMEEYVDNSSLVLTDADGYAVSGLEVS